MIQKPKGTYDVYGENGRKILALQNLLEGLMEKYNYSQTKLSNALKSQYRLAFLRELKQILSQEQDSQEKDLKKVKK